MSPSPNNTAVPLAEAMENAQFIRPCPACTQSPGTQDCASNQMGPGSNGVHKKGKYRGCKRSSMPVCPFCQGHRFVYANRICECSMPALYWDKDRKVWSCGDDGCKRHASYRLHPIQPHMPGGPNWSGL